VKAFTKKKKKKRVLGPIFSSNFNKKRLVISLIFRFWGHDQANESNHFLEQRRRMMMITTLASTCNKTIKVKRPREGGFCVILFGFYFVVGLFFPICLCQPHKFFYHQKFGYYLQIKHIEGFCHKLIFFSTVFIFKFFFIILEK